MKNINDNIRVPVPEHDVSADENVLAIWRRRRQFALEILGTTPNALFKAWRKMAAQDELALKPRRQTVTFGQTRREIIVFFVFVIPIVNPRIAVVIGVPAALVIVLVMFPVAMSVSVPVAMSMTVAVTLRAGCAAC